MYYTSHLRAECFLVFDHSAPLTWNTVQCVARPFPPLLSKYKMAAEGQMIMGTRLLCPCIQFLMCVRMYVCNNQIGLLVSSFYVSSQ